MSGIRVNTTTMTRIRRTYPEWLGLLEIRIGWCRITFWAWFSSMLQCNDFSKMVLRFSSASTRRLEKVLEVLRSCLWSVLALSLSFLSSLLSFLPSLLHPLFFIFLSFPFYTCAREYWCQWQGWYRRLCICFNSHCDLHV